jgi:hypothetical protein
MWAWAYAVEAKYSESQRDRLRALAITLYLDKDSAHIASIPLDDKAKARDWLKANNPFLQEGKNRQIGL